ncbi:MAG: pyrroline-5-carboxylate reductase [Parvibaculales bacterium]
MIPDSLLKQRILLVGGGKMGSALLQGWLAAGFGVAQFMVNEPAPSDDLAASVAVVNPTAELLEQSMPDIIVLAIKPQMADSVLPDLIPAVRRSTVVISLLAGQSIEHLSALLGGHDVIVRTMPNTPAAIGLGMTALIASDGVSAAQKQDAGHLMQAVGETVWLDSQKQMDAVTAISGSGPAYVFYLAETMMSAGVSLGLSEEMALQLARQTIVGAATMMVQSDTSPSQLRRNVTSPNGTTEAALDVLMAETGGLGTLMRQATQAAALRNRQLADLDKDDD